MKLVESRLDKNDNSVQALTVRSEVLEKSIEAKKSKIETLRSTLNHAAESFSKTIKNANFASLIKQCRSRTKQNGARTSKQQ